jgi:hypothetical protein
MAIKMDSTDDSGNCLCPDLSKLWTNEEVQQLLDDIIFWVGTTKTLKHRDFPTLVENVAYLLAIEDSIHRIKQRKWTVRDGK